MSSSNIPDTFRSGQGPGIDKKGDVTSGYNSGDEEERVDAVSAARERRRREEAAREKLKDELLRQFEAGQLKVDGNLSGQVTSSVLSQDQPRFIPTIEEQRDKLVSVRHPTTRPTVPLPDLSRPPPSFSRPQVQALSVPLYQPQPIYSYEDTIVTRVLQSLMGNRVQHQAEPPIGPSQDVVDKVLNWDVVGTNQRGRKEQVDDRGRSMSGDRRRSVSQSREKSPGRRRNKRRSSESVVSVRVIKPIEKTRARRKSNSTSRTRRRSRSRSRCIEKRRSRDGRRSEKDKSDEWSSRHRSRYHTRVLSPLTRKCSQRTPEGRSSKGEERKHIRTPSSPRDKAKSTRVKTRRSSPRGRSSSKYSSPRERGRSSRAESPRPRKVVLLSPIRASKSIRDIINEEKDRKRSRENQGGSKSPVKKRVKDRLGVRKVNPEDIEVFNMDPRIGSCGAVAVVKEFIDSKNGIMELKTTEGGNGAVILFSAGQVWVPDRKRDPNGPPKPYVISSSLCLQTLFPVGQELLVNTRKVESEIVDMQATAVWPKYTEIPEYEITLEKLNEELEKINEICKVENLVPVCINGLGPVGSLNIWSARVRQIIDEDWGVVEIKSVPRDGKREFSLRFFSFFHKHDVWVEEGVRVGDNHFFKKKPLGDIVELLQPVDIVTRSIIREKGLAMKKAVGSNVEMQALCVSLKPACIPEAAARGTRVEGGPGAFGGTNRGETPYMFHKGLKHQLNVMLAKYLQATGKTKNMDPSLVVKLDDTRSAETRTVLDDKPIENEKKIHKLTEDSTKTTISSQKSNNGTVTVDSQNNVVEARHARPAVKFFEKLSNSTARVREYVSGSVGLLENLTKDWLCLFQTSDCVLTEGSKPQHLYPVGTKVQINANLLDSGQQIQYIASCVWIKSENALILPNNVEKSMITTSKKAVYDELNEKISHLDMTTGKVFKILDDNFGIIKQNSRMVLFDTCDFWTTDEGTAAQSGRSLHSLVSVGDSVNFHAAWIQSPYITGIAYLATAVWRVNPSPFSDGKCPVAIRREKIHPDKVKIYEMVSRCSALQKEKPEESLDRNSSTGVCKTKVYDQKGYVKVAFKCKGSRELVAAIVEFGKQSFAFYLPNSAVETHEKVKICIPDTKVYFSAVPIGSDENSPISHIATAVSHIHHKMPLNKDGDKIVEKAKETFKMMNDAKLELMKFKDQESQIVTIDVSINTRGKFSSAVDCFPTGRLVCMFDKKAGILEDHRRELAYFETTDLNLPLELELMDIVMVMTRCRDVTIRFQASHVLDGPVKMIVHDGTVAISSNIERYYPEVQVKKSRIILKPKSFTSEKVARAVNCMDLFKKDKILTPEYIIDSGQYCSTLGKVKRYSSSNISSSIKPIGKTSVVSSSDVRCIVKHPGKVMTILNDSFGLLQFSQGDDISKPGYCLFDTFDLYLEGGKSAAQSNKSVGDVLELGMPVYFHACEILPDCPVSWLATGVWCHEKTSQPKPVPYNKITKEKKIVFKKVAETCKVLVEKSHQASNGAVELAGKSSSQGLCSVGDEENTDSNEEGAASTGEILVANVPGSNLQEGSNQIVSDSKKVDESPIDGIQENTSAKRKETFNNGEKVDNEAIGASVEMKHDELRSSEGIDEILETSVKKEDQTESVKDIEEDRHSSDSSKSNSIPVLVLPESLTEQLTSTIVVNQLDEKMAIFTLDYPAGTKALLHRDRLWLSGDKDMEGSTDFKCVEEKQIKINARRVEGYEEFDYQVISAFLATTENIITPEINEFAIIKQDEDGLNKDLQMFLCLSKINNLDKNC